MDSVSRSLSLMSVFVDSGRIKLNWVDESGCTDHLTSVYLKMYQDGKRDVIPSYLNVDRECLTQTRDNIFSVSVRTDGAIEHDLPRCVSKKFQLAVDSCRKYSLEIKSEYAYGRLDSPSIFRPIFYSLGTSNEFSSVLYYFCFIGPDACFSLFRRHCSAIAFKWSSTYGFLWETNSSEQHL